MMLISRLGFQQKIKKSENEFRFAILIPFATNFIVNFMPRNNGEDSSRYPYNVIFGTGFIFEIESR